MCLWRVHFCRRHLLASKSVLSFFCHEYSTCSLLVFLFLFVGGWYRGGAGQQVRSRRIWRLEDNHRQGVYLRFSTKTPQHNLESLFPPPTDGLFLLVPSAPSRPRAAKTTPVIQKTTQTTNRLCVRPYPNVGRPAAAATTLRAPPRDGTETPLPSRWGCAPSARERGSGWRPGLARARWWFSTRGGLAGGLSFGGTPTAAWSLGCSTLLGE